MGSSSTYFSASDFTVLELRIFDRDGVRLTPTYAPGAATDGYFEKIERSSLPESS